MDNNMYDRIFEGWHSSKEFYGDLKTVEGVFDREDQNVYIGVGLSIDFEKNYHFRIKKNETAYLIHKTDFNYVLAKADISNTDLFNSSVVKLKLSYLDNRLVGYVNDREVISYDTDSNLNFTKGYAGLWIHPELSASVLDFSVEGNLFSPPEKSEEIKIKRYVLSDSTASCWYSKPFVEPFLISNGILTSNSLKYCESILHLFSKNSVCDFSFNLINELNEGSFGFYLRKSPDTAFVKIYYDFVDNLWHFEDVPSLYDCSVFKGKSKPVVYEANKDYKLHLELKNNSCFLSVDNETIFSFDCLRHNNYGKFSFFSDNAQVEFRNFQINTENSTDAQGGVLQYVIETPNTPASSMEIIEATDNALIGIRKVLPEKSLYGTGSNDCIDKRNPQTRGIFISRDNGASFEDIAFGGEYSDLITNGCYQSVIRLKSGKYLQVKQSDDLAVQISDDLKIWKTISNVTSNSSEYFFHTQSLFEFTLDSGKNRLFLPLVRRFVADVDALGAQRNGHDTFVFYSDDGGYTWQKSAVGTNDILTRENHKNPIFDIAECKMVLCDDGSLRLYNTRSSSRYLIYTESFDGGDTWSNFKKVDYMQCAKSSFSIFEDKYNPMTYYLVWVNSLPLSRGNTTERTRLSLARSYNGKTWEFLCDVDRFGLCYIDNCKRLRSPIYQVVDPAVYVTKEYVYVTNGKVLYSAREDVLPGSSLAVHHEQRTQVTRIEKSKLKSQKWDSTTICDENLVIKKDGEWL